MKHNDKAFHKAIIKIILIYNPLNPLLRAGLQLVTTVDSFTSNIIIV